MIPFVIFPVLAVVFALVVFALVVLAVTGTGGKHYVEIIVAEVVKPGFSEKKDAISRSLAETGPEGAGVPAVEVVVSRKYRNQPALKTVQRSDGALYVPCPYAHPVEQVAGYQ